MSLLKLFEIKVVNMLFVCVFEFDEDVLECWNVGFEVSVLKDNIIIIFDVIGEDFWSGGGVIVW